MLRAHPKLLAYRDAHAVKKSLTASLLEILLIGCCWIVATLCCTTAYAEAGAMQQLQQINASYLEAVQAGDEARSAGLAASMLPLIVQLTGPRHEKVGLQALGVGTHYFKAANYSEAIHYLKQAIDIVPANKPEQLKTAHELLLTALALASRQQSRTAQQQSMMDFRAYSDSLGCLVLPLATAPPPRLVSGKQFKVPAKLERQAVAGWAALTYAISRKGRVADIKIVSSWPKENMDKAVTAAVRSRQYQLSPDSSGVPLQGIPLVVILTVDEPELQPPGEPYKVWIKRLKSRANTEKTRTSSCMPDMEIQENIVLVRRADSDSNGNFPEMRDKY